MNHSGPHKFQKRDIGSNKKYLVQHCTLPGCSTYYTIKAVVGLHSLCWKCSEIFTMSKAAARLKHPRCLNCKEVRKPEAKSVDKAVLADILDKLVKA